ncbi:hypothetical protein [Limnoglobus roseus]|uniref:Uncharacterized protein n=1 Tax=Limnoglobus roseus TaxID=2598579 RepID=A0A5C1AFF5_9BACT|nr:hypothetical protein [Limnoglobus roseus]QEL15874.1 hypothetical protein PX52LOC_02810 [Limnoglobus roseus]
MSRRKRVGLLLAGVVCLTAYAGSYYGLSRRGYEFESMSETFYYSPPRDTTAWRVKHVGCVFLFAPANTVDQWLFLGRPPADVPGSPF